MTDYTPPTGMTKSYLPCTVDGCNERQYIRTLCATHYSRWRRTGSVDGSRRKFPLPCTVDDCDVTAVARGLCQTHYKRLARTGTTSPRVRKSKK